jgi:hypothetical protein
MNGGKPAIARADAVVARLLHVIEKGYHHLPIKFFNTQLMGTFLDTL